MLNGDLALEIILCTCILFEKIFGHSLSKFLEEVQENNL